MFYVCFEFDKNSAASWWSGDFLLVSAKLYISTQVLFLTKTGLILLRFYVL